MSEDNKNISLDDISFDDMLGEGVSTETAEAAPEVKEEVKDTVEADELDADAKELKAEEPEEDIVEEEKVAEKKEEEVEEDAPESDTVVSEILSKLGYETDEEYEDTADGLLKLTQDMSGKIAESQLDELFEKFPLVKNHLEYVINGGESQDFMQAYDPKLDYNKIEIDETDSRSQKAILSDYFAGKGHDKDFIEELLEDYEDTGKLYQKAEAAKKALATSQGEERQKLVTRQKEQREQQAKKQEEFWSGVQDTIKTSNDFAGLTVPQKDKGKFFDYISKPVDKEGHTQRDLDHSEAEIEVKLAIDYLMYKGFKLDDIINKKARTKSAKSLRDKISKNEENLKSARKASKRRSTFDIDDLDLSI
jgi:CheY-like chemotaxis protein